MAKIVTQEEIISRFKKVHGDRYDYSLVEYKRSDTKVKIICKTHDVFEQTPSNHLSGKGCIKCGYKSQSEVKTKTKEDFIKQAISIHGNKYDYSKVDYKNGKYHVIITCHKHGDFKQSPNNHTHSGSGRGCPECGKLTAYSKTNMNTKEFVEKAVLVHGNKYDYSKTIYKRHNIELGIICNKHSIFYQKPTNHLSGNGCPLCGVISSKKQKQYNPPGWNVTNWQRAGEKSKNFDSFKVYIIKCWNDNEEFYKIGRTFLKTRSRFRGFPYNYEILKEIIFDNARDAFNKETELKSINKYLRYTPLINFYGMYECFTEITT